MHHIITCREVGDKEVRSYRLIRADVGGSPEKEWHVSIGTNWDGTFQSVKGSMFVILPAIKSAGPDSIIQAVLRRGLESHFHLRIRRITQPTFIGVQRLQKCSLSHELSSEYFLDLKSSSPLPAFRPIKRADPQKVCPFYLTHWPSRPKY